MQPFGSLRRRLFGGLTAASLCVLAGAGLSSAASASVRTAAGIPGYSVTTTSLGAASGGVAVDPSTGMAYVGITNFVTVINEATGTITHQIGVIGPAYDIAVDVATNTIYAATYGAVTVIDGQTNSITSTIPLKADTPAIALNPSNGMLYVAYDIGADIAAISTATDKVTTTVSVPAGSSAYNLAVDAATGAVYAGLTNSDGTGSVLVLDGTTLATNKAIPLSQGFPCIAVNQATDQIYVTDQPGVDKIDGTTYVVTQLSTQAAAGIAVDSAADSIFVGGNSTLDVLDGTTGNVLTTVPVRAFNLNGHTVAFDPTSGLIYATNRGGTTDSVAQLTPGTSPTLTSAASAAFTVGSTGTFTFTSTGSPVATVALAGKLPAGLVFTPGSGGTAGTAVLAGKPAARSGGLYRLTITATNGVFPKASQAFTLTVRQAPSIVSVGKTVFRVGHRIRFLIVSKGFPVPSLRETGRLPRGFTFEAHDNGTATLTGDPTRSQAGKRVTIKITATNGVGRTATQVLTILIRS